MLDESSATFATSLSRPIPFSSSSTTVLSSASGLSIGARICIETSAGVVFILALLAFTIFLIRRRRCRWKAKGSDLIPAGIQRYSRRNKKSSVAELDAYELAVAELDGMKEVRELEAR